MSKLYSLKLRQLGKVSYDPVPQNSEKRNRPTVYSKCCHDDDHENNSDHMLSIYYMLYTILNA